MKRMRSVMTLFIVLMLVAVPTLALAQTPSSPPSQTPSSATPDKSKSPGASPSTSGSTDTKSGTGGQASPAAPASKDDCKNSGWQKLGFKTEAECLSKAK
jgi:hypothetical protein